MFDEEVRTVIDGLATGFPPVHEMTGPEARAAVAARRQPVPNPGDAAAEDRTVPGPGGPLPVRLYTPAEGDGPRPLIVFFHGGGFVFCDLDSHDGFCREMARHTGALVLSVAYRLAPEHKAPAAAYDAHHALVWATEHAAALGGDPDRVLVAGDSAGGNLAAVACLQARAEGGPQAAAQVLLYPVLDPACDTASYAAYGRGFGNDKAAMEWYWRQYLPAGPLPEWLVAPARVENLSGLPPALVVTAGFDPLADEGRSYAAALRRHGVPVGHRHYPGLFHGFLTVAALRAGRAARALLWHDLRGLPAFGQGADA